MWDMDLCAYLHDELNWTNEVSEELENHVLLLLLHLVKAILLAAKRNLRLSETSASVRLELILWDGDSSTWGGVLCLILIDVAILGLELIDESIHILVLLVFDGWLGAWLSARLLSWSWGIGSLRLLIEVTRLDVSVNVLWSDVVTTSGAASS